MTRNTQEYLDLPYHVEVVRSVSEDDTGWVASVEEWDGCIAQGRSPDELMENLRRAQLAWVSAELEDGRQIPPPREEHDFSGQFRVRLPASLHAALVAEAEREQVSLNQFVVGALAGAVGWRAPRKASA